MNKNSQKTVLKILEELYPDPRSELNFSNPYQLLVAVMLSAQCTDKKVNQVTPDLFESYGSFAELGSADLKDIERIIRPINYYRTKAKNLIATGNTVSGTLEGKLPVTREGLMSLPGVGQKTANVVMSELKLGHAFPVDTHVFRVSKRLGLAEGRNPAEVEEELKERFDPKHWRELHHRLIFHGRRICKAQRPNCAECPLKVLCRYYREESGS